MNFIIILTLKNVVTSHCKSNQSGIGTSYLLRSKVKSSSTNCEGNYRQRRDILTVNRWFSHWTRHFITKLQHHNEAENQEVVKQETTNSKTKTTNSRYWYRLVSDLGSYSGSAGSASKQLPSHKQNKKHHEDRQKIFFHSHPPHSQ